MTLNLNVQKLNFSRNKFSPGSLGVTSISLVKVIFVSMVTVYCKMFTHLFILMEKKISNKQCHIIFNFCYILLKNLNFHNECSLALILKLTFKI
ncbi:hypothetical protein KUTeg_021355 [Tegillarca granosa]|uniref:Uncharacterized protein n=1 Tax=Tegillarca granosa TaxID=220873 RepID=A0ABQ9EGI2_TEGGR|nr:hypothetical protein KUTeg_021355 [Tegillarca granosa]